MMRFRRRRIRLFDRPREACLRAEYAPLYPALKAGRWHPVPRLLRRIHRRSESAPWELLQNPRELLQSHFEFRGGLAPRNPAWPFLRQREDDVPAAARGAGERVGRLLHGYARLYGRIRPEQWLPARDLRDEVIGLREEENQDKPAWQRKSPPAGRTLPDEHFEFRLGMSDPGMPRLRTRREDPAFQRSLPGR
jgi:hypothetical protein